MADEDAIRHISVHEESAVRPAREAAALARKMGDKQPPGGGKNKAEEKMGFKTWNMIQFNQWFKTL